MKDITVVKGNPATKCRKITQYHSAHNSTQNNVAKGTLKASVLFELL